MTIRRTACLLLALAGAWIAPAQAQPAPTRPGVTYATVGGTPLVLDLYVPTTGTGPYPVVVWLHDGGWLTGSRALPAFVAGLLPRGLAIASIEYRLTSEAGIWGAESVNFPAQIHDVKGAIRYLRANAAALNLDTKRFGTWGSSSGGHLAALAGTSGGVAALEGDVGGNLNVSSRVQAVVDYYGPIDLLQLAPDVTTPPGTIVQHDPPGGPGSLLIGFSGAGQGLGVLRANAGNANPPFPNFRTIALQASPLTFIDSRDPPFMIVHGTADPQVAIRQSERLRDGLRAVGADPAYVALDGAGHGGFADSVHANAISFLADRLGAATIAVGDADGISGPWFDPATSGQGFDFQWLDGGTLLVFFYGHRNETANLFLVGTLAGTFRYGETLTMPVVATRNGRFGGFDPATVRVEPWGTLTLRFDSCARAVATLDGDDGRQTLTLQRLATAAPPLCD
jgi:acetyl esterase/lipase